MDRAATDITLDLTPAEMVVVTMLASLGEAVMAGDKDAIDNIANLLMAEEAMEIVGQKALDKLHASVKLASTMLKESGGGLPA